MATIAAAVIGAAGAAGSGYMASQAARAGAGGGVSTTTVPLPGYADALNHYIARITAGNITSVAPTFGEWVASGGRATFPINYTGLTPREAGKLGFVDPKTGQEIPFVEPGVTSLTPEQVLYLGQQNLRAARARGNPQPDDPASRYALAERRLGRLGERQMKIEERLAAEDIGPRRERKLGRRLERTGRQIERTTAKKEKIGRLIFGEGEE